MIDWLIEWSLILKTELKKYDSFRIYSALIFKNLNFDETELSRKDVGFP